jgi:4'-phosphopantetheinyl transferase
MEMGLTSEGSLRLGVGQIDVWLAPLSGICSDLEHACLQLLSEPERAKWRRFVAQNARLQYLVSRALVRTTLSRYADVPEHAWQFETNRYGRPFVSHPKTLRHIQFNLSNTTGLVVCAVAKECDIGIDVEDLTRILDTEALAPTVFAPVELAEFCVLGTPVERRDLFFSYWTLKEAYIKARGMGLSIPLDSFWFDLDGSSPRLHVTDRCGDYSERWRFYQYAPTVEHKMAVAVAAPRDAERAIQLRWTTPISASTEPPRPCGGFGKPIEYPVASGR